MQSPLLPTLIQRVLVRNLDLDDGGGDNLLRRNRILLALESRMQKEEVRRRLK